MLRDQQNLNKDPIVLKVWILTHIFTFSHFFHIFTFLIIFTSSHLFSLKKLSFIFFSHLHDEKNNKINSIMKSTVIIYTIFFHKKYKTICIYKRLLVFKGVDKF